MPMPAPVRAALEARITAPADRAQDRETLRLEQETPGRPGRSGGRQLTIHEQEGPPRQCPAGCEMRDGRSGMRDAGCDGCVMEIRFEEFRRGCGALIYRGQPTRELTLPASRIPHPEFCQADFPQLEICRLGQGDAEP